MNIIIVVVVIEGNLFIGGVDAKVKGSISISTQMITQYLKLSKVMNGVSSH